MGTDDKKIQPINISKSSRILAIELMAPKQIIWLSFTLYLFSVAFALLTHSPLNASTFFSLLSSGGFLAANQRHYTYANIFETFAQTQRSLSLSLRCSHLFYMFAKCVFSLIAKDKMITYVSMRVLRTCLFSDKVVHVTVFQTKTFIHTHSQFLHTLCRFLAMCVDCEKKKNNIFKWYLMVFAA